MCVRRGTWHVTGEDATSWRNDAASDYLALPVLFRKYQSPPTQSPRSPVDAKGPPVACRIWGMFEILPLYTGKLIVPVTLSAPQEFRCIIIKKGALLLMVAHCQRHMTVLLSGWSAPSFVTQTNILFASFIPSVTHINSQVIWFATDQMFHSACYQHFFLRTEWVWLVYIWIHPAAWSIYNLVHVLSWMEMNTFSTWVIKEVAVHVIAGLKQRVYLAFKITVAVVWFSATPTHNILIISDVFSGNLKEELGTV